MKSRKIGVILLALLLAGLAMVPIVNAATPLTKEEILKKVTTNRYTPSKEFMEYINAPSITDTQIDEVLKVVSTSTRNSTDSSSSSMSDVQKKFGDYLNSPHGSINTHWAYPYSGDIRLSMTVGSPTSDEYGLVYAVVDVETATILSEGFTDLHKYW